MGTAIIAYDLKEVMPDDNRHVKDALLEQYTNTSSYLEGRNVLNPIPEWVRLRFPNTTIVADNVSAPSEVLVAQVVETIKSVGAIPGAVFAAYIGDHFLWNVNSN